jgi:CDP-diglyceride synthetase
MGDDTVDQTLKTLQSASRAGKASWSLPTWLWTVLVLFAGFWAIKAYNAIAFKNKQGRYKL